LDKALSVKLDEAQRVLVSALRLCDEAQVDFPLRRRVAATRRDILRALGSLTAVSRVSPLYDVSDSDLSNAPTPKKKPQPPAPVVEKTGE
jgi:hypothetical protein